MPTVDLQFVTFAYYGNLKRDDAQKKLYIDGAAMALPLTGETWSWLKKKVTGHIPAAPDRAVVVKHLSDWVPAWAFDPSDTLEKVGPKHSISLTFYRREISRSHSSTENETWLCIGYSNIQEMLGRFFLEVHYKHQRWLGWRQMCIGIGSHIDLYGSQDHMPILEYLGKGSEKIARKDITALQEKFDLGPGQIYTTRRGAHVYFPTDSVSWTLFKQIMTESKCNQLFRQKAVMRNSALLRVSAKYTDFDIVRGELVRPADPKPRRPHMLGLVCAQLIELGAECGTHFASLFPQWAGFVEDEKPWTPTKNRVAARPPAAEKPLCTIPECDCANTPANRAAAAKKQNPEGETGEIPVDEPGMVKKIPKMPPMPPPIQVKMPGASITTTTVFPVGSTTPNDWMYSAPSWDGPGVTSQPVPEGQPQPPSEPYPGLDKTTGLSNYYTMYSTGGPIKPLNKAYIEPQAVKDLEAKLNEINADLNKIHEQAADLPEPNEQPKLPPKTKNKYGSWFE